MLGKNNFKMISEKSCNRSYRYAIRRLNMGVASVAVAGGLLFMGEASVVQAASNEGVTSANVAGLANGQGHSSKEADHGSRALSLDSSHSLTEKVGESASQPVSSIENRAAYYSDLEASDEVLVGGDEQPTYVERNREADQTRTVEDRVIDHKEVADSRTVTETGLGRNHFDRIGPNVTKYDPTEYNPAKADRGPENVQAVQFGNSNALGSRMIHNVQSQRGALVKKEAVSFDKDFELNLEVRLDHHNNTTAADGFGFLFIEGANKGQAYLNQGGILKNRGVAKAFGYKIDIRYNPETSQMDKQGMSNRIAGNQHRGYTAFVRNDQAGNSRIVGSSHGFEYNNKRMQGRYERDVDQFRPEEFEPLLLKYSARSGQFQAIYGDGAGRIVQSINAQALGIDRRKQYTFAITSEVAPYYRGGAGVAVRQDGTARITYSKQEKARVEETRLVRQERESGFDTVYKYNPNLDKGLRRTIQEGKKNIVESQIHIKTINKKEVSRRLVSERVLQQGQNRIIEIGTREVKKVPQVIVKEIPYQTITHENPNLSKGERRVIQSGITGRVEETTTTTYVNGRPQPNPQVTRRVLRDKRDEIVEVGTQEVRQESQVTVKEIPYQTITRENSNLPKGERRVIQSGITGRVEETTTTTYVNGRPQPNPQVTRRVLRDKRDEIVEVGTQEVRQDLQVTVKEIPYQTITRENPNLPKGERRVIQSGITGRVEETTTTTYVNGRPQPNPQVTRRVLRDKRDEIVEVGTQEIRQESQVKVKEIPYQTITRENPNLPKGQRRVIQTGVTGREEETTTTTYINGQAQPNPEVTSRVLRDKRDEIVEVGTQEVRQDSQVTVKEIPYQTITRENPNLPKGERRVIQSGITGRVEETTTTTYVNGRPQPNPQVTRRVLRDKRDEIVEVGTQEVRQESQVTVKEIPYQTITRENPNLPKGERRVIQSGITGRVEETTTTTYVNGRPQPNPQVTRRVLRDKRDEIVEVGTQVVEVRREVTVRTIKPKIIWIDDRELAPREEVVVQAGQEGKVQTITETTYINGVPQANPKVTRTVLAKTINRIIRRGFIADGYRSANVGAARALTYSSPRSYRSATYRPARVRRLARAHYNRPSYSRFFRR